MKVRQQWLRRWFIKNGENIGYIGHRMNECLSNGIVCTGCQHKHSKCDCSWMPSSQPIRAAMTGSQSYCSSRTAGNYETTNENTQTIIIVSETIKGVKISNH
jgi:hypothetical protein